MQQTLSLPFQTPLENHLQVLCAFLLMVGTCNCIHRFVLYSWNLSPSTRESWECLRVYAHSGISDLLARESEILTHFLEVGRALRCVLCYRGPMKSGWGWELFLIPYPFLSIAINLDIHVMKVFYINISKEKMIKEME